MKTIVLCLVLDTYNSSSALLSHMSSTSYYCKLVVGITSAGRAALLRRAPTVTN